MCEPPTGAEILGLAAYGTLLAAMLGLLGCQARIKYASEPDPTPKCEPDRYIAHVEHVVDADTVELRLELPLDVSINKRVRVAKIDAPERFTPAGKKATDFALLWLDRNLRLELIDHGRDKYGRRVGELVSLHDGESLGDALLASGNAVLYER